MPRRFPPRVASARVRAARAPQPFPSPLPPPNPLPAQLHNMEPGALPLAAAADFGPPGKNTHAHQARRGAARLTRACGSTLAVDAWAMPSLRHCHVRGVHGNLLSGTRHALHPRARPDSTPLSSSPSCAQCENACIQPSERGIDCNGAAGICRDRETDLDWKYVQPAVQGHETWKGLYGETDSGTVRCYVKQEIIENVLQENQATYDDSMPMTDADLGHLDPLDRIRILEGCWRIKVHNLSKHILSPFFGNRNISSCAIKDVMGMKRSLGYADDFLNENDREGSHYYLKYCSPPLPRRFDSTTPVFGSTRRTCWWRRA